jgi:hypothetical protein
MEPYGKRVSEMLNNSFSAIFFPDIHRIWTACRTRFINEKIEAWISNTEGKR